MRLCGAEGTARRSRIPGTDGRLRGGSSLHSHCTPQGVQPVRCRATWDELLFQVAREIPHSFPSPSPNNPSALPALFANRVAKLALYFLFFFFWKKKKVDESRRLKNCAIQQTNFLFCLLSVLIYRTQLNIIEAGSWFAVWAIWRRISFFVIMPRRRLKRINRKSY